MVRCETTAGARKVHLASCDSLDVACAVVGFLRRIVGLKCNINPNPLRTVEIGYTSDGPGDYHVWGSWADSDANPYYLSEYAEAFIAGTKVDIERDDDAGAAAEGHDDPAPAAPISPADAAPWPELVAIAHATATRSLLASCTVESILAVGNTTITHRVTVDARR